MGEYKLQKPTSSSGMELTKLRPGNPWIRDYRQSRDSLSNMGRMMFPLHSIVPVTKTCCLFPPKCWPQDGWPVTFGLLQLMSTRGRNWTSSRGHGKGARPDS